MSWIRTYRGAVGVATLVLSVSVLSGCNAGKPAPDAVDASGETTPTVQGATECYNTGDFAGAERILSGIVASDPDDLDARRALALALAAQEKNDLAIEQYGAILEIDSKDHASLYRMALLERLGGSVEQAAQHLEAAVALQESDSYVDELARTYFQLGDYEKAADTWAILTGDEDRAPESAVALMKLQAEALRLAGDFDAAREVLEDALDLSPKDADLKARLEALEE